MNTTDAPALLCLDCARTRGMATPLALLTPHEGRCEVCGRCTLVVLATTPVSALTTWRGP